MMEAKLEVGCDCEVAGLAEEQFANSWWAATFNGRVAGKLRVTYRDMLVEDGKPDKLVEVVGRERVRPAPPDDSHTVPIAARRCGECVDCWHSDGWWTGYVHHTYDDYITVYFPDTNEVIEVRDAAPGGYTQDDHRVRTARQWLHGASRWDAVAKKAFDGGGNHRTPISDAQPANVRPSTAPASGSAANVGVKRKQPVQLRDDDLLPPAKRTAVPAAARVASAPEQRKREAASHRVSAARSAGAKPVPTQPPVKHQQAAPPAQQATQPAAATKPPLPARPEPKSLAGKGPTRIGAAPLKRQPDAAAGRPHAPVDLPQSSKQQNAEQRRPRPGNDPWAMPAEKVEDPRRQPHKAQHSRGQGGGSAAAAQAPQHAQQRRPGAVPAPQRQQQGTTAASRPVPAGTRQQARHADVKPGAQAGSRAAALSALRRHRKHPEVHPEPAGTAGAAPDPPKHVSFVIPKMKVEDDGPKDLDISNGPYVCLDNIGALTHRGSLEDALRNRFKRLREVHFADVQLDREAAEAGIVGGGWACLEFSSSRHAALAYPELQRLYLAGVSPGPPRPLLAHWPRWRHLPWGDKGAQMLGHLKLGHATAAHFVQPNSIEFEMALQWRLLGERLGHAKRAMQVWQQAALVAVLGRYSKAKKLPVPACKIVPASVTEGGSTSGSWPRSTPLDKSYIWLKGIATDTDLERVRLAFEQFTDDPKVVAPKSAVSGTPFGHLVVTMKEPRKASLVMRDLCENIFVMHGTPRPVGASVARPGAPLGSQRLYDEALEQVFGTAAIGKPTAKGSTAAAEGSDRAVNSLAASGQTLLLVQIPEPAADTRAATVDERAALKLRKVLAQSEAERAELWRQGLEMKRQLHQSVEAQYSTEKDKYAMVHKLNDTPIVRQLNGGRGMRQNGRHVPYRNLRPG